MLAMQNGPHVAVARLRVVVRVVRERSARRAALARATVVARAVLAEPAAVSVHRPAHRAPVRLRVRLVRVHVRVAGAREADRPSILSARVALATI